MKTTYSLWPESCTGGKPTGLGGGPPAKPPRTFREQRSPVRVEPFRETTNRGSAPSTPNAASKWSGHQSREELIEMFKIRVGCTEPDQQFCGAVGMDAMLLAVQKKNNFSLDSDDANQKAERMLDHWLAERVIQPVRHEEDDSPILYVASKRVFYIVNPPEKHRVVMMTPRKAAQPRSPSRSRERSTGKGSVSRKGSFKRFFRGASKDESDSESTVTLQFEAVADVERGSRVKERVKTFLRPATPVHAEKEMIMERDDEILGDDAMLFDAALFRLLLVVEMPFLEGLQSLSEADGTSVSFLSSILKRMGLTSDEGKVAANQLDTLRNDEYLRTRREALAWFEAGARCAPSLVFRPNHSVSPQSRVYQWAHENLKAVSDRCSAWTHRGSSPLVPVEFEQVLQHIASHLCCNARKQTKRDMALRLLWHLIPRQCRRRLDLIMSFLVTAQATEPHLSLKNDYFIGPKYHSPDSNMWMCWDTLRIFILPQTIRVLDQNSLIECLILLKREEVLNEMPFELKDDLERRRRGGNKTPVNFGHTVMETPDEADRHIVDMIKGLLTCTKFSASEKKKQLDFIKETYPHVVKKYFPNL